MEDEDVEMHLSGTFKAIIENVRGRFLKCDGEPGAAWFTNQCWKAAELAGELALLEPAVITIFFLLLTRLFLILSQ